MSVRRADTRNVPERQSNRERVPFLVRLPGTIHAGLREESRRPNRSMAAIAQDAIARDIGVDTGMAPPDRAAATAVPPRPDVPLAP